jgi:hypothetical protein
LRREDRHLSGSAGSWFEGPGDKEFGDGVPCRVGTGRTGRDGAGFPGGGGLFDRLADGGAVGTGKECDARSFFKIFRCHFYYEHGEGWVAFVQVGHGQCAGAHFCRHSETGEVGGTEGVFRKPGIGYRDKALVFVHAADTKTREEGAGHVCQQVHPEAAGAGHQADKVSRMGGRGGGRRRLPRHQRMI